MQTELKPTTIPMNTYDISRLLHKLKPDDFRTAEIVLNIHRLANQVEEILNQAHTAITTVTSPTFKGEVIGELHPWPNHYPLELDHTGPILNDIIVRGTSVSEHLAKNLWEEAEAYIKKRFSPDTYHEQPKEIE